MNESKILIVDDNIDARKGLAVYLNAKGYHIQEAESGERAVELLKNNNYDLVLTDLKMQAIDGIGVLNEALKQENRPEVIIMTAFASIESAVEAIKLGAYDYICKPLNMDEFEMAIERCLEKQKLLEEVKTLKEIIDMYIMAKNISSIMDPEELLSLILKLARDSVNADGSSLMLFDKKENVLVVKIASGSMKDEVIGKKFKLGDRVAGRAAEQRSPILQQDIAGQNWYKELPKFENIISGMSLPMLLNNELIGVINLKRTTNKELFTDRDLQIASVFSEQAAYAINNNWMYEKLKNLEKTKSEVISNLSYNLKTSMMPMKTSLDLILSGKAGNPDPVTSDLLGIINRGVNRMNTVLKNIIDFSRLETGDDKLNIIEFNIDTLADETIENLKHLADNKDIKFKRILPSKSVSIHGDKVKLQQCLENIISNAITHTPPKGKIQFEIKKEKQNLLIYITNTGSPIDSDIRNKIFEKFFTTNTKEQKLGLGLTITKKIIDMHAGKIILERSDNEDTCFQITLPL